MAEDPVARGLQTIAGGAGHAASHCPVGLRVRGRADQPSPNTCGTLCTCEFPVITISVSVHFFPDSLCKYVRVTSPTPHLISCQWSCRFCAETEQIYPSLFIRRVRSEVCFLLFPFTAPLFIFVRLFLQFQSLKERRRKDGKVVRRRDERERENNCSTTCSPACRMQTRGDGCCSCVIFSSLQVHGDDAESEEQPDGVGLELFLVSRAPTLSLSHTIVSSLTPSSAPRRSARPPLVAGLSVLLPLASSRLSSPK